MQYLLTESELLELKEAASLVKIGQQATIFRLCKQVANLKPIDRSWDSEDKSPWGCITNEIVDNPGYCDNCPVQNFCPYEHKKWSQ